jgi:signal transduction histidine kinase
LWIATLSSGLHYFNPATGEFRVFKHHAGSAGLSYEQLHSVCIDREGYVWVGTASGLDRLDPKTQTFVGYNERDGMPNSNVSSVVEDEHGELWIGTNNGISRFNPRTRTFRNYFTADGLLGNEFYNYASSYRSPRGDIFFNSYSGVISFRPDDLVDNPYVPPVVLTDFQLFSRPVPVGDNSPLKESISVAKSIVLNHKQSIFSLEFSALSYANPERNRYRYKLAGLDPSWIETDSTRRFVTYTTLPPGDYVFRLQGSNNRGLWNEEGVALRIRVLPPWWGNWWLRVVFSISVVAIAWLIFALRLRAIQQRNLELAKEVEVRKATELALREAEEELRQLNAELEERVAERTEELESTNKELEAFTYSVSHDLRAPLRHISGFSSLLVEEYSSQLNGEALDCLDKIEGGAERMARLIDDLLKLSRLGRDPLSFRPVKLNAIVEDVRTVLRQDYEKQNVEWKIDKLPEVEGDSTLLSQVYQNLIANSLKFAGTRNPAVIEIGSDLIQGKRTFFVRDNGVGFDMKYAGKLFGAFQRLHKADQFEGTGIGLATVQRIIRKHGGTVWAEAEVDKGATFYFTLGSADNRKDGARSARSE